jgi:hypothetical protein
MHTKNSGPKKCGATKEAFHDANKWLGLEEAQSMGMPAMDISLFSLGKNYTF